VRVRQAGMKRTIAAFHAKTTMRKTLASGTAKLAAPFWASTRLMVRHISVEAYHTEKQFRNNEKGAELLITPYLKAASISCRSGAKGYQARRPKATVISGRRTCRRDRRS